MRPSGRAQLSWAQRTSVREPQLELEMRRQGPAQRRLRRRSAERRHKPVARPARSVGRFRRSEERRNPLLDRDALRQIAGLVDVASASDGNIAGEQLQRHARCNGAEAIAHLRNIYHVIGMLLDFLVAFGGNRHPQGRRGPCIPEYWKSPCRTWGSSWQPRSQGSPRRAARWGHASFHRRHTPRHAGRKFP